MFTITNNETDPIILRKIRIDTEGEEIDCLTEMQLLPAQSTDLEFEAGESWVVFRR